MQIGRLKIQENTVISSGTVLTAYMRWDFFMDFVKFKPPKVSCRKAHIPPKLVSLKRKM